MKMVRCPRCKGSGLTEAQNFWSSTQGSMVYIPEEECGLCHGKGRVDEDLYTITERCRDCKGTGRKYADNCVPPRWMACWYCGGRGTWKEVHGLY